MLLEKSCAARSLRCLSNNYRFFSYNVFCNFIEIIMNVIVKRQFPQCCFTKNVVFQLLLISIPQKLLALL